MDKYLEDKEDNQWDGDFIFDTPALVPAQRKRGGSSSTSLTAHLSATNPTIAKEKRKSAANAWSNAFKNLEADPRQANNHSTTQLTSSSRAAKSSNQTSTTSTTTTVVHTQGAASLQSNAEFAFFDSEDQVGFQKPATSYYSTEADDPSVHTALEGSGQLVSARVSRQPSRDETFSAFDDGLGDANLGFDDDDYIPNVGFDEDEVYVPGVPRPAQLTAPPPALRHLNSANASTISSWQNNSTRSSVHSSESIHSGVGGSGSGSRVGGFNNNGVAGGDSESLRYSDEGRDHNDTAVVNGFPVSQPSQQAQPQQHPLHTPQLAQSQTHQHRSNSTNSGSGPGPRQPPRPMFLHSRDTSTSSIQLQQQAHQQQMEQRRALEAMIESDEPLAFDVFDASVASSGAGGGSSSGASLVASAALAGRHYPFVSPMVRSVDSQDAESRQAAAASVHSQSHHHRQQARLLNSDQGPVLVSRGGGGGGGGAEPLAVSPSVRDRVRLYERREYLNHRDSPQSDAFAPRHQSGRPSFTSSSTTTITSAAAPVSAPASPQRPTMSLADPQASHTIPDAEEGSIGASSAGSRQRAKELRSRSRSRSHSSIGSGTRSGSVISSQCSRSRSRLGSPHSHLSHHSCDDDAGSPSEYFSESDGSNSDVFTEGTQESADWDADLEPSSAAAKQATVQTFKDIITGRTGGRSGAASGVDGAVGDEDEEEEEKESLLDYLKRTVQKTLFPPKRAESKQLSPENRDLFSCRSFDSADGDGPGAQAGSGIEDTAQVPPRPTTGMSTPSLLSRDVNMETYEEEGHTLETANPHLKGLLDWVEATTQSVNSVLTSTNSSRTQNARTLLHTEVDLPDGDLAFMEMLLERAEQLPTSCSEQCVATLEIVCKWLRALCNLHDSLIGSLHYTAPAEEASAQDLRSRSYDSSIAKFRRTSSLGETRLNCTAFSIASQAPNKNDQLFFGELSGRRIDTVYDGCDEILQELLVSTTTALGTNYRKLLSISARSSHLQPAKHGPASSGASTWLTQMGMIPVKDAVNPASMAPQPTLLRSITAPSDDGTLVAETVRLSSQLIALYRLQINMLEVRIHMYDSYELVGCLELLEKLAEELDKVTGTLFAALKRVLPPRELASPEQAAQRDHLDGLTSVAQDLLGCCFAIKVFAVCGVSPINFQQLPEHCQRISQTAQDAVRLSQDAVGSVSEDSGYYGMGHSDSNSRSGPCSQKQGAAANTYNVIHELTLGTHFLELMMTLPSPSVVRSKMYLAVYAYLSRLKKKQLPWQSHKYKLISLKQPLDSFASIFNLYQGADAFGLNYSDLDNNSFALTLAEVEGSIVQSFGEVFGALDQARILQLLLYESAVELLPTAPHDTSSGPAAFRQPKMRSQSLHPQLQRPRTQPMSSQYEARRGSGAYPETVESEAPSEPSQPGADKTWAVFTSMRGAFRHFSPALNLDKALELDRRSFEDSPADSPAPAAQRASRPLSSNSSVAQHMQDNKRLLDTAPTRPKPRQTLSYSCRFELFRFAHHVLYRLAQTITEMSPNVALDLYQVCIVALGHLRRLDEKSRIEKIAVMLAVKVGRRDAAIWHGEAVLRSLQRRNDNINEMLYLTDLLAAQYSENAQYELAAKALFSAISALNDRNKREGTGLSPQSHLTTASSHRGSEKGTALVLAGVVTSVTEFERTLDPLLLKLGKLLLQFGCADRAADTFQVLLSSLCERTDCLANDAKKVTVLSWLAEAYLALEQYDTCAAALRTIKAVRALKLHKAVSAAIGPRSTSRRKKLERKSSARTGPPSALTRSFSALTSTPGALMSRSISDRRLLSQSRDFGDESPRPSEGANMRSIDLRGGIAVLSSDSFDLDGTGDAGGKRPSVLFSASAEKGADSGPPTTRSLPRQSSSQFGSRPLPPTPRTNLAARTPGGGEATVLRNRPLPPTPLDLSALRGQDAHLSYGMHSVRDTPRDGTPQDTPRDTPRDAPKETPRANLNAAQLALTEGGSNSQKSAAASSVALQRTNSKRQRKAQLLKNLQPLELSNNNILASEATTPAGRAGTDNLSCASPFGALSADSEVSPSFPAVPAQSRPQSAINSIYTHYVRNPPEANLPQFCPTIEDLDLGHLKARLLFKGKKYASALRTLHPTLMAVEIGLVGRLEAGASSSGGNGTSMYGAGGGAVPALSRQALMELGELYCLRGRIQVEAAKSCADVSFPFQVGSTELFDKVASMLPVMPGAAPTTCSLFASTVAGAAAAGSKAKKPTAVPKVPETRRFAKAGGRRPRAIDVDLPSVAAARSSLAHSTAATAAHREKNVADAAKGGISSVLTITTREPRTYGSSADLCWDAMKWFGKARDIAKLVGDEIGGALLANSLAACHLLPLFVPSALMKIPLDKAADLSGTDQLPVDSKGRQKPRRASLREVQNLMKGALEVHSQSCLPLPLMDTYLNLAEMCHLVGNASDAVALWSEAKELFLLLFVDGALVPLVRRGSAKFVRRIQSFVDRLVRFMFVLDKPTFNGCLHLLDTQVLLGYEVERMARRNKGKAEAVSGWLPDVLRRLVSGESSSKEVSAYYPSQFSASSRSRPDKRKTVSRLSRFFSRLFRSTSDAPPVEQPSASAAASTPTSAGTSRAAELSVSGGSARLSGNLGKASNSFDSFIERSGFSAQLDMRRFYNMMNADLVAEKVLDFGWSDLVDYESLLQDCGGSIVMPNPEPALRHFSNSSQSTTCVRYAAMAASAGLAAPSVEALIQLNLKAKVDCAVKYRRLAAAAYLHDHVLRRAQLLEGGDVDPDNWHANLASLAVAVDGSHPIPSAEAAEIMGLFRTTSMYIASNGSNTPRSDRSPKSQSLMAQLGVVTPRKAALLNATRNSATQQKVATYELPIDPFADFDWMGESFADYTPHGRSLQVRAILDRMHGLSTGSNASMQGPGRKHRRTAMGSDAAQFNALFMPEFDEAHQYTAEEVQHQCAVRPPHHHRDTTGSSGLDTLLDAESTNRRLLPSHFNAEYLRSVDERAETVLIQRAWRCLLLLQNALKSYRSAERSMGHVRHEVRCGLCNLSLTMVRLRAFSRQYQGSLVDYERLQEDVPQLPSVSGTGALRGDSRPIEAVRASLENELLMLHNTAAPSDRIREVRSALRDCRSRQAVMLSQRLPFVVFAIHVEDNLMLYRPHDGSRVMQKLGGQGLTMSRGGLGDAGSRETTPRDGPAQPRSAPPTPPPVAPALGIAQVERRSPAHTLRTEPRVLEPKISLISMLSLFSGSDVTRDSTRITPSSAAGSSNAGNQIDVGRTGSSSKFRAFGMSRKDSGIARPALRKKSYFFSSSHTLDQGAESTSDAAGSGWAPERVDSGEGSEPFAGLSLSKSISGPRTTGSGLEVAGVPLAQTSSTERHRQVPSGSSASHSTGESAIFPSEAAAAMAQPSRPALRMRDTRFLYDLAVAAADRECGGGKEGRRMHWAELRDDSSALSAAVAFLRGMADSMRHHSASGPAGGASNGMEAGRVINALTCSSTATLSMNTSNSSAIGGGYRPDPLVLAEIDGSSTSSSSFVALSASMSNMLGLFSSTDSGDSKHRGNSSLEVAAGDAERGDSRHTPEAHTPLTVISSRTAASLPWEALLLQGQLVDVNVVRHLALVALCAQAYTPAASAASQYSPSRSPSKSPLPAGCTVGPQWLQQPSLVAMCRGSSSSVFMENRSSEAERMQRTVAAKASIAALHHTTAHLHTNSSADTFTAAVGQSLGQSHFQGCEPAPAALLPSTVPLTIGNSHILGNEAVISLAEAAALTPAPLSARSLWRHLTGPGPAGGGRARRIPCNHFPLVLLGYSDYLQLADSVAHLLSSSRHAVLIFAPLFLIEPLAIELKLALDRWCKSDARAHSPGHSDEKFEDLNDGSSQLGSAAELSGRGDRPLARSKSLNTSGRSADHGDDRPHSGMFGKSSSGATKGIASFLNRTAAALVPNRSSVARSKDAKGKTGGGSGSSWQQSMPQIAEEPLADTHAHHSDPSAAARSAPVSYRSREDSRGSEWSLRAKSRSSNNMDLTGPSSPSSRRSQSSAAPTVQVDTHGPNRALAGRDRTWPYHVIMSVVREMQRDHDVPIVVFV